METATPDDPNLLDKVINLAKRRGFIFPSAEIYADSAHLRLRSAGREHCCAT